MSTIKSSDEHLTINADGSGKEIKFQCNGTEVAKIDSTGFVGAGSPSIDDNGNATAITIDSSENVGIGLSSPESLLHLSQPNTNEGQITLGGLYNGSEHNAGRLYFKHDTGWTTELRLGTADNHSNSYRDELIIKKGYVTMPYQPAFLAIGNTGSTSYSAGSAFVLQAEAFDRGGNYNTTNGRFTAPSSGIYTFQYGTYAYSDSKQYSIKVNGSDYVPTDAMGLFTLPINKLGGNSITLSLSSSDYVQFGFRGGHSGSVYLSHTYLSGHLIG